jgi:hypothetical protein
MDTDAEITALRHAVSQLARAVEELAEAVLDAVQGRSASEVSGARDASHTARHIATQFADDA